MNKQHMDLTKVVWTLNQVEGFGVQSFKQLKHQVGDLSRLLDSRFLHELREDRRWSKALISRMEEALGKADFEHELEKCHERGFRILSILDSDYPKPLAQIYNPPLVLYIFGELVPEDEVAIAIVGTRHPTFYGIRIANQFARTLASRGVTIVSGLAQGIDGESHRGAIQTSGRTIAVLGSGLDIVYPKQNASLYELVARQGAVVSEFPLGTQPVSHHFPRRNRIISGLSMGVVVVEANQRSGSLITASYALEDGREVYAIPGPIDSIVSQGTNRLILNGARPVTSPEEILEDLLPQLKATVDSLRPRVQPTAPTADSEGDPILDVLSQKALHFDQLLEITHEDPIRLKARLLELELKGVLKRSLGGLLARV